MKKINKIVMSIVFILAMSMIVLPVFAYGPILTGESGVNRGSNDVTTIFESKSVYYNTDGHYANGVWVDDDKVAQAVAWVGIQEGSDCHDSICPPIVERTLTPTGLDWWIDIRGSKPNYVVSPTVSLVGGAGVGYLKWDGGGSTFAIYTRGWKIGDYIRYCEDKGVEWRGTWKKELYYDYRQKSSDPNDFRLVKTLEFTIRDKPATSTTATTTVITTTAATTTTPAPPNQVPAIIAYGISANGVGAVKTSWGPGDSGQNLVAWIKISPGSEMANGQERYTVHYRLLKPDGTAYYDNLNNGNAMSFNRDGSADMIQYPVSELLAYPGNWKVEYYIHDASTGTTTLENTQRFTITSATQTAVPTTAAPTRVTTVPTQQTRVTTAPTPVVTQSLKQFASCPAGGPSVYIEDRIMQQGKSVTIPVMMCNAQDMSNMDMTISYDTRVLSFTDATKGSLNFNSLFENNEPSKGTVKISFAFNGAFSGSGSIAILTFNVIGSTGSTSPLKVTVTSAGTSFGTSVTIPTTSGNFVVGTPITGDYDGDNQLTARDALAALQISVGKRAMDPALDVTGDGSVNSMDARAILKIAVS
jgi:hypothetical protein